jgi:hypothetical protein
MTAAFSPGLRYPCHEELLLLQELTAQAKIDLVGWAKDVAPNKVSVVCVIAVAV